MVLAFESSCDETCASVVREDLTVLSNIVASQIDIHKLYGGVVPEIASRNHAMAILPVCEQALAKANVALDDITHIASVTGPGLRGAVMVGEIFGRSLAVSRNLPFVAVNHLAAHIASVAITNNVKPPFISLLVSGGHTALYNVKAWDKIELLCTTQDDAVGEAFDKVAKLLGLPYPGGVQIEKLATGATTAERRIDLITFVKHPKHDAFSYSGLKTAVLGYVNREKAANRPIDIPHICASFQHEAVMQLVMRSVEMMKKQDTKILCVCGGVSANGYLREKMQYAVAQLGGRVFFPSLEYCGDNAAMAGVAAILNCKIG
jgi:N6-L-threonylcarbamoyladenine synthase